MSTWTDDQHTTYANARLEWFETNQPTWICAGCKDRVVEYAPEMAGDPCDHTAYCAGCVEEQVAGPMDDEFEAVDAAFGHVTVSLGGCWCRCQWAEPHGCIVAGPGAQSYAAHVAAGALR